MSVHFSAEDLNKIPDVINKFLKDVDSKIEQEDWTEIIVAVRIPGDSGYMLVWVPGYEPRAGFVEEVP